MSSVYNTDVLPLKLDMLTGSFALLTLLLDVTAYQKRVRFWWTVNKSKHDVDKQSLGYGCADMLTDNGEATVVPKCSSHDADCKAAGFQNPFEHDWHNFDASNPSSIEHLSLVVETSEEQIVTWDADNVARTCFTFKLFKELTQFLMKLHAHALNNPGLLWFPLDMGKKDREKQLEELTPLSC